MVIKKINWWNRPNKTLNKSFQISIISREMMRMKMKMRMRSRKRCKHRKSQINKMWEIHPWFLSLHKSLAALIRISGARIIHIWSNDFWIFNHFKIPYLNPYLADVQNIATKTFTMYLATEPSLKDEAKTRTSSELTNRRFRIYDSCMLYLFYIQYSSNRPK